MKGIFYEGKPLGELLDVLKDQETSLEFNETVETVQKSIYKTPLPTKPKSYFPHSKVRKLTPQQIRKEYGIMQPTLLQEIIVRLQTDDLTGVEIRRAMGKEAKASGHISGVLNRALKLCPEFLERRKDRKWALIQPKVTTIEFVETYNNRKGKNLHPFSLNTNTIKMPNPAIVTPKEPEVKLNENVIENLIQPLKDLNIKINIEGNIKITFGIDGR